VRIGVGQKLCKNKKKLKRAPEVYEMVRDPRFLCRKCGRAARRKKYLCRARKITPEVSLRVA
jgi:hypothetical protein